MRHETDRSSKRANKGSPNSVVRPGLLPHCLLHEEPDPGLPSGSMWTTTGRSHSRTNSSACCAKSESALTRAICCRVRPLRGRGLHLVRHPRFPSVTWGYSDLPPSGTSRAGLSQNSRAAFQAVVTGCALPRAALRLSWAAPQAGRQRSNPQLPLRGYQPPRRRVLRNA